MESEVWVQLVEFVTFSLAVATVAAWVFRFQAVGGVGSEEEGAVVRLAAGEVEEVEWVAFSRWEGWEAEIFCSGIPL